MQQVVHTTKLPYYGPVAAQKLDPKLQIIS